MGSAAFAKRSRYIVKTSPFPKTRLTRVFSFTARTARPLPFMFAGWFTSRAYGNFKLGKNAYWQEINKGQKHIEETERAIVCSQRPPAQNNEFTSRSNAIPGWNAWGHYKLGQELKKNSI